MPLQSALGSIVIEFIPSWCIDYTKGGSSLQQEYSIRSGEETIGKVLVKLQGLYYRICCRCQLTGTVWYKLLARCGDNTVDLGLCIPVDGGFGVDTRIPIKRLGEGELTFRLVPKHNPLEGKFVQISPDEPFRHIRQLQKAHLARQDGHIGVVLTEDQSSKDKPTGQWSEPITWL